MADVNQLVVYGACLRVPGASVNIQRLRNSNLENARWPIFGRRVVVELGRFFLTAGFFFCLLALLPPPSHLFQHRHARRWLGRCSHLAAGLLCRACTKRGHLV